METLTSRSIKNITIACSQIEVTPKKLTPYFEMKNEVFNEKEETPYFL